MRFLDCEGTCRNNLPPGEIHATDTDEDGNTRRGRWKYHRRLCAALRWERGSRSCGCRSEWLGHLSRPGLPPRSACGTALRAVSAAIPPGTSRVTPRSGVPLWLWSWALTGSSDCATMWAPVCGSLRRVVATMGCRTDHKGRIMQSRERLMNRRQFGQCGAAAVAATACASSALARPSDLQPPNEGWIDAHSHIWAPNNDSFPLAPGVTVADLKPRSFTEEELLALARPLGVERAVLIQHSTYYRFDNAYLIDVARRHPHRFRVVGMIDDQQPNPDGQMRLLLPQRVTGVRISPFMRRDSDREGWLETPGMHQLWRTAAETRQAMCCLIDPQQLPQVAGMAHRYSETPVVIDHFAHIGTGGQVGEEDLRSLCALAECPLISVKISAYYALGRKQPPHLELVPMIRRLCETFGPQRLMWGSDSPYQTVAPNNYAASLGLVRDHLDFLSDDDRHWLLAKTAQRVFQFDAS